MKKKTPGEKLLLFSWIYIICVIVLGLMLALFNMVPEAANQLKIMSGKSYAILELNVTVGINIFIYLWYFLLARRAAHGNSRGTLYMILLLVGFATKITHAVITRSILVVLSINFVLDILAFYYLYKVINAKD